MDDRDFAQSLASAGRALVHARYSFTRMVDAVDRLYDSELTRRAPGRVVESQYASL
jgi:hypothetical protein